MSGGESGPAIEPGKPDESLLVEAIRYDSLEMPPDGQLEDAQIAAITKWIEIGSPWPDTTVRPQAGRGKPKISDEDRAYWAFQPLRDSQPPALTESLVSQRFGSVRPGSPGRRRLDARAGSRRRAWRGG